MRCRSMIQAPARSVSVNRIKPHPRLALALPYHPRTFAPGLHSIVSDLVFERVHRLPEALVPVRSQQLLLDQAAERSFDELLAGLYVVEDVRAEREEAAVHVNAAVVHGSDALHHAVGVRLHQVEALERTDGREARDDFFLLELLY